LLAHTFPSIEILGVFLRTAIRTAIAVRG